MVTVVPSDIYPAVRRFLVESGLQRTLKAFDKEASAVDDAGGVTKSKPKKARALAELELTVACELWVNTRNADVAAASNGTVNNHSDPEGTLKLKKKESEAEAASSTAEAEAGTNRPERKRKRNKDAEEAAPPVAEEPVAEETETDKPRKKKQRELVQNSTAPAAAEPQEETEEAQQPPKKKKNKEKNQEKKAGTPFKRIDEEKWTAAIADNRLLDNTHKAKNKFGGGDGDSWGDKAAEDLGKVKGKGFRKEMAKKKRSSWRGGGGIDMGVNSVKFDDNSDDE